MTLVFAKFVETFISSFPVLLGVFKFGSLIQFLLSLFLGLGHFSFSTFNCFKIVKLRVLSPVLVNSWLTPGEVYKMSREDPEIRVVMGWPTI